MIYTLISLLLAVIAAYLLFKTAKFLVRNDWLLGWFRGMIGITFICIAAVVGLAAWDLYSYKQIMSEQTVCNVSFKKLDEQHYIATLTDKEGQAKQYDLRGDQWQIDARIVKWNGMIARWGVKPAYRLDRISGRYFDLEKETSATRTAHAITASPVGLDVWLLLNKQANWISAVDAIYGSATYLPMKDGANFEVTLSNTGLVARPINEAAREAVSIFK
jgi:hypothetical protein